MIKPCILAICSMIWVAFAVIVAITDRMPSRLTIVAAFLMVALYAAETAVRAFTRWKP